MKRRHFFYILAAASLSFQSCATKKETKPHWSTLPDDGPDTDPSMDWYWELNKKHPMVDPTKGPHQFDK